MGRNSTTRIAPAVMNRGANARIGETAAATQYSSTHRLANLALQWHYPRTMVTTHDPAHDVHLYESDHLLCRRVAQFIADGIRLREAVVAIVTPVHHALIVERLLAMNIDVRQAVAARALQLLDADDVLELFMTDKGPDPALFRARVGHVMREALESRSPARMRVYGEMADLLCQRGLREQAVQLETLGNELAAEIDVTILCAYAASNFPKHILPAEILVQHTHTVNASGERVCVPVTRA
jgi:hypothetical protein